MKKQHYFAMSGKKSPVDGGELRMNRADLLCSFSDCRKPAAGYCKDGCHRLCRNCLQEHSMRKFTRTHRISKNIHLEQNTDSSRVGAIPFCEKHDTERLLLYCTECNEVMCTTCHNLEHSSYKALDINIKAEKNRSLLRSLAVKCEELLQNVKQSVETREKNTDKEMDNIEEKIKASAAYQRLELDKHEQMMLKQVEACRAKWHKQKHEMKAQQHSLIRCLENTKQDAEHLEREGAAFQLCTQINSLQLNITQASQTRLHFYEWNCILVPYGNVPISQCLGRCETGEGTTPHLNRWMRAATQPTAFPNQTNCTSTPHVLVYNVNQQAV